MKPAVLGVIVGIALGATIAFSSCTVDRPSDSFKCSGQADCDPGRVCTQGYCVVGTLPADARGLDAFFCPTICNGGCDAAMRTCTITGTGSGNITCPQNWNCDITCGQALACGVITCPNPNPSTTTVLCNVDCLTPDACLNVMCQGTTDCDVTCTGSNACGNISCTTGDCTADCTGTDACGSISCSSGRCKETCSGGSAACGPMACGTGRCEATCMGSAGGAACSTIGCANSCRCDVTCDSTNNLCPATMTCPDDAPGPDYCTVNGSNGQRCDSSFASQCNNSGC